MTSQIIKRLRRRLNITTQQSESIEYFLFFEREQEETTKANYPLNVGSLAPKSIVSQPEALSKTNSPQVIFFYTFTSTD